MTDKKTQSKVGRRNFLGGVIASGASAAMVPNLAGAAETRQSKGTVNGS